MALPLRPKATQLQAGLGHVPLRLAVRAHVKPFRKRQDETIDEPSTWVANGSGCISNRIGIRSRRAFPVTAPSSGRYGETPPDGFRCEPALQATRTSGLGVRARGRIRRSEQADASAAFVPANERSFQPVISQATH